MYVKKITAIATCVVMTAIGFGLGSAFSRLSVNEAEIDGDMSAAMFSVNDPDVKAAMEALSGDSVQSARTLASIAVLSGRVNTMHELAEATLEATADIEQLSDVYKFVNTMKEHTAMAKQAYSALYEDTQKAIDGDKPTTYKKSCTNAQLALSVLDRDMDSCAPLIDKMADYLREHSDAKVDAVAVKWIEYCAEDAVLNEDKEDTQYWATVYENAKASGIGNAGSSKLSTFPTVNKTMEKAVMQMPAKNKETKESIIASLADMAIGIAAGAKADKDFSRMPRDPRVVPTRNIPAMTNMRQNQIVLPGIHFEKKWGSR